MCHSYSQNRSPTVFGFHLPLQPKIDHTSAGEIAPSTSRFIPNPTQCYLVDPPQEFDEEEKELGPDAQVWKTYVKEADQVDEELVDGWNKSMDVNLIFAALFSAISTAFVIESYKNLKPDPADVSAQTLLVISQTLLTIANGSQPTSPSPIPGVEAPLFKASASAICVNVLWFLSLSLSVAVSLISMLAKEWCLEFMAGRTGPFGAQARRRQQRWDGIVEWRMKEVIVMLPSLIHLSLLLFAIGLSVFLWDVHYGVAIPVVLVTVFAAGAYFASTLLPFLYDYCPYGTVLSRLHKQFYSVRSPVKRAEEALDEVPGKALHWMIVNCETPRSVDVALQSIAAADWQISPAMLERCDAWSLIRQRLESVNKNGEQAEVVSSLYKRALEAHVLMRREANGLYYALSANEQLTQLVLGVQSCMNSVIHKLLGQLGPLDQNRSVLERCALIGPRLLEFELETYRFRDSDKYPRQALTRWRAGPPEYNERTHSGHSETLAKDITRLLEQHMRGKIDIAPDFQCILSASLVVLLCLQMKTGPDSEAAGYFRRLIQAYLSESGRDVGDTRNQENSQRAFKELDEATFVFLMGALSMSYSHCSVEKSPFISDQPADEHTNRNHPSEKVVEVAWTYLMGFVYPDTSSFNKDRSLIHGGLHLLARAGDYGLTSNDCNFIANRMDKTLYYASETDDRCLDHHLKEFATAPNIHTDPDTLSAQLSACLRHLPQIAHGYGYLNPTPELYVLALNGLCRNPGWGSRELGQLMVRFPFPNASPRLIDALSKSSVVMRLVELLDAGDRGQQAFATAQLWLLFNMSIQAPDRTSPALSTLEKLLLQYPGLKNNLETQEVAAAELESRLIVLMDEARATPEPWRYTYQIIYLFRVLECMLQQRCTPLPEETCNNLQCIPESLRGIASFVDLEAEASQPPSSNTVPPHILDANPV
ncbi:unnamed protein product [Rhizoctonia solani]|uniref:DUF6535 domain-containing protein n=1 Tax=Rhizoctonia solani TaxID=456999 RepID=A0A8H3BDE6_9AGAM|nr:unnamed protein product [Rhizoctonia solani]